MTQTRIDLARQAIARIFTFGTATAGGNGKVTIERGTAPITDIGLDVKASGTFGGDLNVGGDLNIVGSVNRQNVTELDVADKTITLNKGGAAGSGNSSGIKVEAGGAVVGKVVFDDSSATLFTIGDGTSQRALVDASTAQVLTNKTLQSPTLTGAPTAPTAGGGTNSTQVATTGFVQQELAALGATSGYFRATTLTGTQDGTNKTFTLSSAVSAGSEQIFINGQMLNPGAANDYVLSGAGNTTLTFQATFDAPLASDVLRAYGVR